MEYRPKNKEDSTTDKQVQHSARPRLDASHKFMKYVTNIQQDRRNQHQKYVEKVQVNGTQAETKPSTNKEDESSNVERAASDSNASTEKPNQSQERRNTYPRKVQQPRRRNLEQDNSWDHDGYENINVGEQPRSKGRSRDGENTKRANEPEEPGVKFTIKLGPDNERSFEGNAVSASEERNGRRKPNETSRRPSAQVYEPPTRQQQQRRSYSQDESRRYRDHDDRDQPASQREGQRTQQRSNQPRQQAHYLEDSQPQRQQQDSRQYQNRPPRESQRQRQSQHRDDSQVKSYYQNRQRQRDDTQQDKRQQHYQPRAKYEVREEAPKYEQKPQRAREPKEPRQRARRQPEEQTTTESIPSQPQKPTQEDDRPVLLVLNIGIGENNEPLEVREGDDPVELATNFCKQFEMLQHVKFIADQIRDNLERVQAQLEEAEKETA